MDILEIDEKIRNDLQGDDYYFHLFDTILLIEEYERTLDENESVDDIVIRYLKEVGRPLPNFCINCFKIFTEYCEICEECHVRQGRIFHHKSFGDDRIGSPKSVYSRQENFRKVIERFQGRQNVEIPREVYDGLEKRLRRDSVVSKKDIRTALKKLGLSKYYGDVHLIHHEFTGVPTHDIREYEDDLLYDFDLPTRGFSGRNFFNPQRVLCELLGRHGYQCDRSEFFIPKLTMGDAFSELCRDLPSPVPPCQSVGPLASRCYVHLN